MIKKERNLTDVAANMRSLGKFLLPFTYPQTLTSLFDSDLDIFREREVYVDGYSIILYYQKSDYGQYLLETLQIYNKVGPFLPFCVVLKAAITFLGSENLSLVEIFKSNRKIYCWSLATDYQGASIEFPYYAESDGENCTFEGISYFYINPSYVNFY
jgi:hypothetical protein